MFMSFLIRASPFFEIVSWDFFNWARNFFAVCFGFLDFSRRLIAFWRSGSVGLVDRIFFADCFVGFRRNAWMPAFATFSAPWILIDFMSDIILLKAALSALFFIDEAS